MPTIRRCCIIGCPSNSRQHQQLQFFQFPRPENPFHSIWKQACHASLSRILPFKKPVVCAHHFHPNCIGGRRLISSSVPSLRLEVPTNLKAFEQQAMVEEIERSRKCAYINAVVYEWLVRANLNSQLRGSITHGMIKEKAETAKQVIAAAFFVADNRWLNRFRETHLAGFAHKLATNQLRPSGPSLWIPDIVQDLQHMFPPTSADRMSNFENVPEQYYDYMQQQYGEYEDDDEQNQSQQHHQQQLQQHMQQQELQQQQQQQHEQQQQQNHQLQQQSTPPPDSYEQHNYNYDDFYYERQAAEAAEYANSTLTRPPSQPQQQLPQLRKAQSPYPKAQSPYASNALKRPRNQEEDDDDVVSVAQSVDDPIETIVDDVSTNGKTKSNGTCTPPYSNGHGSPKQMSNGNGNSNGPLSNGAGSINGHTTTSPGKDLANYAQALEYLKPLEDFALFKENFRAIGLISQLEMILRKGSRLGDTA